ncbi:hypothetical protein RIEGSTA812A_PEG_234 [invertebrate metagenome]|uniref:Uncharacterized protein n=1 Tax=invertebrate metagenome TaxID=1711999 RepID=A0A484H5Y0_9ZZZZ
MVMLVFCSEEVASLFILLTLSPEERDFWLVYHAAAAE